MDNITLQLNSPITEDQWDAITDVDFENTEEILFTTKHKKNVRFVKAQQWIPCSERLPDINEEVLTCDNYGTQRVYTLTRISDDEVGWENDYGFYQSLEDVEAWMPLPEPYKGEE